MPRNKDEFNNQVVLHKFNKIRKQELDDFQKVLNTPEGRRFFIRLLEKCNFTSTSFTGNSTTFFNEGKREIALLLLNDINSLGFIGLELKQAAEREFLANQIEIEHQVKQEIKNRMDYQDSY